MSSFFSLSQIPKNSKNNEEIFYVCIVWLTPLVFKNQWGNKNLHFSHLLNVTDLCRLSLYLTILINSYWFYIINFFVLLMQKYLPKITTLNFFFNLIIILFLFILVSLTRIFSRVTNDKWDLYCAYLSYSYFSSSASTMISTDV